MQGEGQVSPPYGNSPVKVAIVMQYRIFGDFCQGLIAALQDEESSAARRAPWHQRTLRT